MFILFGPGFRECFLVNYYNNYGKVRVPKDIGQGYNHRNNFICILQTNQISQNASLYICNKSQN